MINAPVICCSLSLSRHYLWVSPYHSLSTCISLSLPLTATLWLISALVLQPSANKEPAKRESARER